MAAEDCFVNVDGFSSSDSENGMSSREEDEDIDVEADEGLDLSEMESGADLSDEGWDHSEPETAEGGVGAGGYRARKGHHNELEKKRRRTLNASYARLKRLMRKMHPGCKVSGRDRTLELANKSLRERLWKIHSVTQKTNEYLEKFKLILEETTDEEKRKEIMAIIAEGSIIKESKLKFHLPPEGLPSSSSGAGSSAEAGEVSADPSSDESSQSDDNDAASEASGPSSPQSSVHEDEDYPTPCATP